MKILSVKTAKIFLRTNLPMCIPKSFIYKSVSKSTLVSLRVKVFSKVTVKAVLANY